MFNFHGIMEFSAFVSLLKYNDINILCRIDIRVLNIIFSKYSYELDRFFVENCNLEQSFRFAYIMGCDLPNAAPIIFIRMNMGSEYAQYVLDNDIYTSFKQLYDIDEKLLISAFKLNAFKCVKSIIRNESLILSTEEFDTISSNLELAMFISKCRNGESYYNILKLHKYNSRKPEIRALYTVNDFNEPFSISANDIKRFATRNQLDNLFVMHYLNDYKSHAYNLLSLIAEVPECFTKRKEICNILRNRLKDTKSEHRRENVNKWLAMIDA